MPQNDAVDDLRAVDLFAHLSDRALQRLAQKTKPVLHAAGKEVSVEGGGAVSFHVIRSGRAEVEVGGDVVRTLGPGDYFGELSLLDGQPRSATVRALEETTTLAMVAWDFSPLLDDVEVCKALLVALAGRLRESEQR